jgi:ATPase subunit of ABC transporter with duplicated ATPase domains
MPSATKSYTVPATLRGGSCERVCLVGRNGAGKSTLMKILNREQGLDDGRIIYVMVGLQVGRLLGDAFRDKIVHRTGDITRRILLQTRNGAGKSTLMKILNREQGLDDGRIIYEQDLIVAFVIFDMQLGIIQQRRIAEGKPGAMHTNQ